MFGRKNKYHVAPKRQRTIGTRTYASKAEMKYAAQLKIDPDVRIFIEQPRVYLGEDTVYKPDFFVLRTNGDAFYVDVKGVETTEFKRTKLLWEKYGKLELYIVTNGRTVEIVRKK